MKHPQNAVLMCHKEFQLMKQHTHALLLNWAVQESEKLHLLIESSIKFTLFLHLCIPSHEIINLNLMK
jgi:hypothetical protein